MKSEACTIKWSAMNYESEVRSEKRMYWIQTQTKIRLEGEQ